MIHELQRTQKQLISSQEENKRLKDTLKELRKMYTNPTLRDIIDSCLSNKQALDK